MMNKVTCTNDLMFECITALCFIHGFKLLWVNGFTTGLCSTASFMSQIAKNHATLMRMLAAYDSKCFFVIQMQRLCPTRSKFFFFLQAKGKSSWCFVVSGFMFCKSICFGAKIAHVPSILKFFLSLGLLW